MFYASTKKVVYFVGKVKVSILFICVILFSITMLDVWTKVKEIKWWNDLSKNADKWWK
jgi:hypothetical protein